MLRKRTNRWAVALAALVLGGSELGSAGHVALVRHALCAEHGEPVHGGPPADEVVVAAATDSVLPGESAGATTDEHEHCKILAGTSRVAPGDGGFALPLPLDGNASLAGGDATIAPSVALFRLAPKNSPPGAG
jgi:hypothetical protein